MSFKKMTVTMFVFMFAVFSLVCAAGSVSYAQEGEGKEVVAEGSGAIDGGDTAKARRDAIKDAQRYAVEQAVGVLLTSETFTKNFQVIEDKILTKSEGYAKMKEVLEEKQVGPLYKVKILAVVYTAALKKDLDALFAAKHFPRVMIVIPETHIGAKVPDPAGETEMVKKFLEKGFKLIDQNQVKVIRENESVRAALKGDTNAAVLLGKKFGAEVIIVGEAFSEENPDGSMGGMKSCRARVEGRAINVDTAEIITADGKQAGGVDATMFMAGKKALMNAGGLLADYMIDQILSRWTKDVTKGTSITIIIHIKGEAKYKKYNELKAKLEGLSGAQGIDERDFDADAGQGEVELRIQGSTAQDIAGELDDSKTKSGYKISVVKVTSNRVEVSVQ